jgi:hypothetical protein
LRWVAIVGAVWLATVTPALAQSPSAPDPAPSGSQSPRPDPAPVRSKPAKPVVKAVATVRVPVQSTTTPAPTSATTTVAPARTTPPARHRATKKPVRHQRTRHAPAATKHRAANHLPSLPHLTPVRLVAPPTTDDSGRARKLAAGALSLLILALASATLLAFTARVERRRVVR